MQYVYTYLALCAVCVYTYLALCAVCVHVPSSIWQHSIQQPLGQAGLNAPQHSQHFAGSLAGRLADGGEGVEAVVGAQEVQAVLCGQLVQYGHRAEVLGGCGLTTDERGLEGGDEKCGELFGVSYTCAGDGRGCVGGMLEVMYVCRCVER